jgi:hypothetical protein
MIDDILINRDIPSHLTTIEALQEGTLSDHLPLLAAISREGFPNLLIPHPSPKTPKPPITRQVTPISKADRAALTTALSHQGVRCGLQLTVDFSVLARFQDR